MEQRQIRRVSRARAVATDKTDTRLDIEAKIKSSLQSIAKNTAIITAAAKQNEEHALRIEGLLKDGDMPGFTDGVYSAEFVDVISRTATTIDTTELYNAMPTLEDFLAVVKPSMADVKKYMTENQINEIAVTTPPKKTGVKLVIEPVKTKVTTVKTSRRK